MQNNEYFMKAQAEFEKIKADFDKMKANVKSEVADQKVKKQSEDWRRSIDQSIEEAQEKLATYREAGEDKMDEMRTTLDATMKQLREKISLQ